MILSQIILPNIQHQSIDESIFNELYHHELEIHLKKIIKESNILKYLPDKDRFPNIISIKKTLEALKLSFEIDIVSMLLWVLASTFEIIAIFFVEKPEKFEDYHFIDSNYKNLISIKDYFYQKMSIYYKEIYSKILLEKNINNILSIDPVLYNFKNQNEYLIYQYAKIYNMINEHINRIDKNPSFMSYLEIENRRKYAIYKLKEKYKLLIHSKSQISIHEEKEVKKAIQKNRRATDDPRWKTLESTPNLNWDMVFKTLGTNMVIRILLRREDFSMIKQFIEEEKITNKEDLNYILYGLNKIEEHGNLNEIKKKITKS